MRADPETEAVALDVLDRFCAAFADRDADAVMDVFARDPDIVMVTSEEALLRGPGEVRAFLRRYAGGATVYSWRWERREVSAAGSVAWLVAEGTEIVSGEAGEQEHPYRMTLVCEQRGGRWLLSQIHGSSPD